MLLKELCQDQRFSSIIAITRRPLDFKANPLIPLQINSLDDLRDLSNFSNIQNIDVLFCCLGTTIKSAGSKDQFKKVDYEGVKILSDAAETLKIKHFILVSAAGANKNSSIFYNKVKGEAEDELLKHSIPNITIFRPGLLILERNEFRFGELLAIKTMKLLNNIIPKTLTTSIATDGHALVQNMITYSVLENPGRCIIEARQIN